LLIEVEQKRMRIGRHVSARVEDREGE
jgi:hypothetical protein